jgi:hypothetical protein
MYIYATLGLEGASSIFHHKIYMMELGITLRDAITIRKHITRNLNNYEYNSVFVP